MIENCDDDMLPNEAKVILASNNHKDSWEELTRAQQTELTQLINEPYDKDVISNEEYLNMTAR